MTEQSGINAGDGGFQINVAGNTDLKGGKIASSDKAAAEGKNSLTTETLTQSDLQNHSDYKAESRSIGIGAGYGGSKLSMNGTGVGVGSASGSESSTTRSGISQGDITITDSAAQQAKTGQTAAQTLAGINTDVSSERDTSGKITKNWDGQQLQNDVQAQAQITQMFGKEASKLVGDYALVQMTKAADLLAQSNDPSLSADQRSALQDQAQQIKDQWGDQGTLRLLAHTVVGGLTGDLSGAAGSAAGTLTALLVAEALKNAGVDGALATSLTALASTLAGSAAGGTTGASTALNETANNYLRHAEALRLTALA